MTQHPEEGTLHAYIDGELSPAETAALELHVERCAGCAAELAEARGLAAAASRVITTLDAAPSSAAKPLAPVAGVTAAPSTRVARPPAFRIPYARAAALLLLVGGTAFVFDRAGTSARGRSTRAESVLVDAAVKGDVAATSPAKAQTELPIAPIEKPEPRMMAAPVTTDGATRPRAPERSAPPPTTAPAELAGRGVAGGVATKDAIPAMTKPSSVAGREAASDIAPSEALAAGFPPPARMRTAVQERAAAGASNLVPIVVRYRTKGGIIVMLTEEPLRTSFAEDSLATQQSESQPAQQRMTAASPAPTVNTYRWSSSERGKIFTLSGPLTVAELEALSKRLSELERLP